MRYPSAFTYDYAIRYHARDKLCQIYVHTSYSTSCATVVTFCFAIRPRLKKRDILIRSTVVHSREETRIKCSKMEKMDRRRRRRKVESIRCFANPRTIRDGIGAWIGRHQYREKLRKAFYSLLNLCLLLKFIFNYARFNFYSYKSI